MFDIRYDDFETVKQIRAKALANLAAGLLITEFASEGTSFKGISHGVNTKELLLATERYFDEYNNELITETTPNFNSYI